MPRYKLKIEYDGTNYFGWQSQDGLKTIQGALEKAFAHFSRHDCTIFGAGRTDAGVHALGQVAHIDLNESWRTEKIREAANGVLKLNDEQIAILSVEEVDEDFDARFSAVKRHYRYRIINRWANLTVERDRAWHVKKPLNVEAMHKAAQGLLGRHDFTTFRSTDCQAKNPERTLDQFDITEISDTEIEMGVSARAFLHNQVRSLAGSIKLVGAGKWSKDDLLNALEAKDRKECGPVAPAEGLYLVKVDYSE